MSMYVCLKTLCLSRTINHTRSNIRAQNRLFQKMNIGAEQVCMFENPLPVMENDTYMLKHTRSIIIKKQNMQVRVSVYV